MSEQPSPAEPSAPRPRRQRPIVPPREGRGTAAVSGAGAGRDPRAEPRCGNGGAPGGDEARRPDEPRCRGAAAVEVASEGPGGLQQVVVPHRAVPSRRSAPFPPGRARSFAVSALWARPGHRPRSAWPFRLRFHVLETAFLASLPSVALLLVTARAAGGLSRAPGVKNFLFAIRPIFPRLLQISGVVKAPGRTEMGIPAFGVIAFHVGLKEAFPEG